MSRAADLRHALRANVERVPGAPTVLVLLVVLLGVSQTAYMVGRIADGDFWLLIPMVPWLLLWFGSAVGGMWRWRQSVRRAGGAIPTLDPPIR